MTLLISFSLVLHMVTLGIYLGQRGRPITPRLVGSVFAWMVAFHLVAGLALGLKPEVVDPRVEARSSRG